MAYSHKGLIGTRGLHTLEPARRLGNGIKGFFNDIIFVRRGISKS